MLCYIVLLSSILISNGIIASEIGSSRSSAECDILGICIVSLHSRFTFILNYINYINFNSSKLFKNNIRVRPSVKELHLTKIFAGMNAQMMWTVLGFLMIWNLKIVFCSKHVQKLKKMIYMFLAKVHVNIPF